MPKIAIIENGVVMNIALYETAPEGAVLADGCDIGDMWDGSTFAKVVKKRSRDAVLADLAAIDTKSIRALRENNQTRIAELEAQAQTLRTELAAL